MHKSGTKFHTETRVMVRTVTVLHTDLRQRGTRRHGVDLRKQTVLAAITKDVTATELDPK